MKKILLTLASFMGIAAVASAQLASGSLAPDFTMTDVYGVTHHLYDDLNNGKTVIIDCSAAWCHPCWLYHQTGALDSIWAKHGPAGQPGVDATTTNDVIVYFIEGETTNTKAELTNNMWGSGAVTTGGTYATFTQGNWMTGTNYYTIDDSSVQAAWNSAWHIAYFPTVYMVCRDHIVYELTQPTEAVAYAAVQAACPTYGPSSTVDAKTAAYQGSSFYVCNSNPSVKFQNYSTSTTITAATITVKDATGATVATVPWTGSLAPYAVTSVAVPSFAGTTFGGYKYSVTVAGDSNPGNDVSVDSVFKIYTVTNAASLPGSENFESTIPYKEGFNSPDGNLLVGAWTGQIGADGAATNALIFRNYNSASGTTQDYAFGNFNTSSATAVGLQFDVAYVQYSASTNDALAVKVSTDCGATWTTAWTQSGATLATAAISTAEFHPTAASQWKHVSLQIAGGSNNMVIKFTGTSAYGNNAFVDNIKVANATAISTVAANNEITIAPNPATDNASIFMTLNTNANVQVQVIDALGRVMSSTSHDLGAGAQKINVSTSAFPAGVYNVKMVVDGVVTVKQLSVTK